MGVELLRVLGELMLFEATCQKVRVELGRSSQPSQPPPAGASRRETEESQKVPERADPQCSLAGHAPGLPGTGTECWPPACLLRLRPKLTDSADPACHYPLPTLDWVGASGSRLVEADSGQGAPQPAALGLLGTIRQAGFNQ